MEGFKYCENFLGEELDQLKKDNSVDIGNFREAVFEASLSSAEIFGRCLDASLGFQELKENNIGLAERMLVPEMHVLKARFRILIQCYRALSRGMIPGPKLLLELFYLMDEMIIRRGLDLFEEIPKELTREEQIYMILKDYFSHSKKVFEEKLLMNGNILQRRTTFEGRSGNLALTFSEVNSLRLNVMRFLSFFEAETNLSRRWKNYVSHESDFLKSFREIDSEERMKKFFSFPADSSFRSVMQEKFQRLSELQSRIRNQVKEEGMFYEPQYPKSLSTEEQERKQELNTEKNGEELETWSSSDPFSDFIRTGDTVRTPENSSSTPSSPTILRDSVLQGISSTTFLISSRLPRSHGIQQHVREIQQRLASFWANKSPTIQQYRFQLLIEGIPEERERLMKEKRRRRGLLGSIAVNATKHVVSIQSQKQIDLEKKERERLRLLRENDLEAYLELVKETKNRRLQELINQTDRFLLDIGLRVQDQKEITRESEKITETGVRLSSYSRDAGAQDKLTGEAATICLEEDKVHQESLDQTPEFVSFPKTTSVASYYTMAHSISERISDKPMKLLKGGQLLPYQVTGVEWMLSLYNNKLHGILADEMGLGKTVQTIALLTYLFEHKDNRGPHLVVVPLSTLPNWQKEFEIWSPKLKVLCFKGSRYERRSLIHDMRHSEFNICLTTFDFIIRESGPLQSLHWRHIIVDEGHRLKNSKSKFHVVLADFSSENRLLLTGTPLQNSITELWSLLNFLLPQVFHSVEDFQVWFSKPFSDLPSGETSLELSEEERLFVISRLHSILRPFLLRRVKSDVLQDLPEKKEYIVRMELTPWQKIVYDQIKQKAVHSMDLSSGKIQYRSVSNTIIQLRKIVNHPYLFVEEYLMDNDDIFRVSSKFEILDRMLPKLIRFKHKVLIFCQMTQLMDILGDFLDYRKIEYQRLDGTMTIQERKEKMDEFNSPDSEKMVFILSTRAGGLGLNLQAADTVIIFDSDWNPHQDLQAQSRAHRMGQKNEVRVLRFVSISGVEELVLKRAQKKLEIDHKIIQAGMFNSTQVEEEEREDRLKELFGKEEYKSDSRLTTPSEINTFLARNEEELKAFEDMDKKTFGRNIYQKIQEWSRKVMEVRNEENHNTEDNDAARDPDEVLQKGSEPNSELLELGNSLSKSPPKPKKPGRKQKPSRAESFVEENPSNHNNAGDVPQSLSESQDNGPYLECMEKAGRIISMEEVPDWIVRPPDEMNAELGIEAEGWGGLGEEGFRDLARSERKSRWKSNKDYLCVEGMSEKAFLKVMEKYESGEIVDITKELLKETNKRRRSLPPASTRDSGSLTLRDRGSMRSISSFRRQSREERRRSSSRFSSPAQALETTSEKSREKKRRIIPLSEGEDESEKEDEGLLGAADEEWEIEERERGRVKSERSTQAKKRDEDYQLRNLRKRKGQGAQKLEREKKGTLYSNDEDDDFFYKDHNLRSTREKTPPKKPKGQATPPAEINPKLQTPSISKHNTRSKTKDKDDDSCPITDFLLSADFMEVLPDTPEAIPITEN
ncbi:putative SWI2/SNF2 Brahma-like [Cryptosporidium felis]|nr:putative SWI2/SNF2 Brahma-like [Cryptosporidium felis]